jgi:epoxyqueuosine reductase
LSVLLPTDEVRALAAGAGFDLCGFARPDPIPPHVLGDWLAAGMCADMDWMRTRAAERLDVRRTLPNAGTVVSLACNYYRWSPEVEGSPISRYARGRDYHATLRDRIRAFRRGLRQRWPTLDDYASVDTGAVMERVWAVRAGLGVVGKNGCLITDRFGSWVFLAVMVLDAEVDRYDAPREVDVCGSCTLCISACPTSAIVSEGVVDARLCLSYQTIENAGPVPHALRGAFERRAFGCDICQDVCPLNAQPLQAPERFAPRAVAGLGVRELAALSSEDYAALTPGTPLARAGYDGLRRNAVYALGAMRDAGARPLLLRLSADPSPLVQEAANWALEQLGLGR